MPNTETNAANNAYTTVRHFNMHAEKGRLAYCHAQLMVRTETLGHAYDSYRTKRIYHDGTKY